MEGENNNNIFKDPDFPTPDCGEEGEENYKLGRRCAYKLHKELDSADAIAESLKNVAASARARTYAINLNSNCKDRDMDLSILGAVFARPPAQQQQNMFSETQSLNAFAVSIKNYHPFDMQLLPFVIFKNVHTGETYAFPYLVFNLGATIVPRESVFNNIVQALALGGLLRVNGNKSVYGEEFYRTDLVIPAVGVVLSPFLLTKDMLPDGDYVASISFLGWAANYLRLESLIKLPIPPLPNTSWPESKIAPYLCNNNCPVVDDTVNTVPYDAAFVFMGWVMSATLPSLVSFNDKSNGITVQLPWPIWGSADQINFAASSSPNRAAEGEEQESPNVSHIPKHYISKMAEQINSSIKNLVQI